MRFSASFVLLGLTFSLARMCCAEDAEAIIRRARACDKNVSYRGIKVVHLERDERPMDMSMKIIHLKPDKTRTEYFSPEVLAGRIIIDDGSSVWRFSPQANLWEPVECGRAHQRDHLNVDVLENFTLSIVGDDIVAGRRVHVIHVRPRLPGESSRRLWIDREHYLLLAMQVESSNGRMTSSSRFKSIEFNPGDISPSLFEVPKAVESRPASEEKPPFPARKPRYAPEGYKLVGTNWNSVGNMRWYQFQYSNGANTISVFQRKLDSPRVEPKDISDLHNVFTRSHKGMHFTLIGVVSRSELRKMAESIR